LSQSPAILHNAACLKLCGIQPVVDATLLVDLHAPKQMVRGALWLRKNRRGLPFVRWTGALGLRDAPARAFDGILPASEAAQKSLYASQPKATPPGGANCRKAPLP
jgi:hypothetical protein